MKLWSGLAFLGVGAMAVAGVRAGAAPAPSPKAELTTSAGKGIAFLKQAQGKDGGWQSYPGITAVCTLGLLKNGLTERDPVVARACEYLVAQQKPNGAIYTDALGPAQALPNYNTALSLAALNAAKNPKYAPVIKKAQQFLANSQFDEGEGFKPTDPQYGGIGYGSRQDNPDLSNLQNALEALRDSGYPKNSEVFKKAILFLQRCQNRSESNDQPWAGNDGGFIYAARGESKADDKTMQSHSSYGSMTYAGLKSYLYCNVSKSDPRVQAAWTWLRSNYDVEQNPRMGLDGLYYYYHTLSKTLAIWGQPVITDASGAKHRWSADLTAALVKRQGTDGSWKNTNARWREDNPVLVTGYALIALGNCRASL